MMHVHRYSQLLFPRNLHLSFVDSSKCTLSAFPDDEPVCPFQATKENTDKELVFPLATAEDMPMKPRRHQVKPASASNDVYLSLLATRAITGLAQLAKDPSRWDAKVQEDLKKGITFCESIETDTEDAGGKQNDQLKLLRKLTANLGPVSRTLYVSPIEIRQNKDYLVQLLDKQREPKLEDLISSITFFSKATSGKTMKPKQKGSLF
jgi:hypothetical protein